MIIGDTKIALTDGEKVFPVLKEMYTTAKDATFMEVALYDWNLDKILTTSREMQDALINISEEYSFYKSYETYYSSLNSTNLKLYIQDAQGNVLLNNCVDENTTYEEYFKNNITSGIIYNSSNKAFVFTDQIIDAAYDNVESFKLANLEGYTFAIGIDKQLAHNDEFSQGNKAYINARISIIVLLASALVILLLFVYLTAVCGRSTRDEVIHLNGFDKVKTEIGAGIMCVLGLIGFWLASITVDGMGNYYGIIAGLAVEAGLFTLGFLSLAKRIKAGQLWKNSICYMVIRWIILFFQYRKVTTKVAVLYTIFSFFTAVTLGIAFGGGSAFGLLVWFVFASLVGVWLILNAIERQRVLDGIKRITDGELEYKIDIEKLKNDNKILAEAINNIGEGLHNAVDASMRNERLKTDLITNVSHDIKTPLTSIINYVDLIKRENIDNEKVKGYIEILDQKSQRLKNLTEDLVEASKISSGNIKLEINKINLVELINQTEGEFSEKFDAKGLQVVQSVPNESIIIEADGRRIWRVVENLYNNVAKYAMPNTRVYVDLKVKGETVEFSIKNMSEHPLNISADELTERFIRGDVSRSTEGSGLGLSIAKNLTTLQKGTFEIYLDGDLFRVTITFPRVG
jgi:signal transduction histidine kinase